MTTEVISIILAITLIIVMLILAIWTDILRERVIDPKTIKPPYSFSNSQMFFWLGIIAPAVCLQWGYNPKSPYLNLGNTEVVLLSIIGGITLVSKVVSASQISSAENRLPGPKKNPSEPSLKALTLESKGFILDIISNDQGQLSIARLQHAIFTIVFGVIYVTMFFEGNKSFPKFEEYAYLLMGISGSSYLLGKGLKA